MPEEVLDLLKSTHDHMVLTFQRARVNEAISAREMDRPSHDSNRQWVNKKGSMRSSVLSVQLVV